MYATISVVYVVLGKGINWTTTISKLYKVTYELRSSIRKAVDLKNFRDLSGEYSNLYVVLYIWQGLVGALVSNKSVRYLLYHCLFSYCYIV